MTGHIPNCFAVSLDRRKYERRAIRAALPSALVLLCGTAHAVQITTEWVTNGSGAWTNAANWSDGIPKNDAPPNTDTYEAIVDLAGTGAYTVQYDAGGTAHTIDSLTVASANATVWVRSGLALTLLQPSSIGPGTLMVQSSGGGAAFNVNDTLSVSGAMVFNGGSIDGSGEIDILSTGTFSKTVGLFGPWTLDVPLNLHGQGSFVYSSGSGGTVNLNLTAGSSLHVHSGGELTIDCDVGGFDFDGASALFVNEGTIEKIGAEECLFSIEFNNDGLLCASEGLVSFRRNSDHAGDFIAAAGAILDFQGSQSFASSGAIDTMGDVVFQTVTADVDCDVAIGGSLEIGEASAGPRSVSFAGDLSVDGAVTVYQDAEFEYNGENDAILAELMLPLTGTTPIVSGTGRIVVTDVLDWEEAIMTGAGTTVSEGMMLIGSIGADDPEIADDRTVVNEGGAVWSLADIRFDQSGTLRNAKGATFVATSDAMPPANAVLGRTGSGPFLFDNEGEFTKENTHTVGINSLITFGNEGSVVIEGGVLSANTSSVFDNDGVLDVIDGEFLAASGTVSQLSGSTLSGGSWIVQDDGVITLTGASITTLSATVRMVGAGSTFDALENNILSVSSTGSLSVEDGRVFTNPGDLANSGALAVSSGGSEVEVGEDLVLNSSSMVSFEIAGDADFGSIDVAMDAAYDGTLEVTLAGMYQPEWGDSFTIVTHSTSSGDFSSKSFPTLADPTNNRWWSERDGATYTIGVRRRTDLNRDGMVGSSDHGILLGSWGPCAGCDADLNGDGQVNSSDNSILLGDWGMMAP